MEMGPALVDSTKSTCQGPRAPLDKLPTRASTVRTITLIGREMPTPALVPIGDGTHQVNIEGIIAGFYRGAARLCRPCRSTTWAVSARRARVELKKPTKEMEPSTAKPPSACAPDCTIEKLTISVSASIDKLPLFTDMDQAEIADLGLACIQHDVYQESAPHPIFTPAGAKRRIGGLRQTFKVIF